METLRSVFVEPTDTGKYRLDLWDTGRLHSRGTTILGYRLTTPSGSVLFEGEDFSASPLHADDSDETLRALLSFLTLRPGDTDSEYFANYTTEQREWCESYDCEALQLWTFDPLESCEPQQAPFEETGN